VDPSWLLWRICGLTIVIPLLLIVFGLGGINGKPVLFVISLIPLIMTAGLHMFARMRIDDGGFELSEFRSRRILWSDLARIEMTVPFEMFPGDPFAKSWLKIYFKREVRFGPRARVIGFIKVSTYLSIPPMTMPAKELAALLNHCRLAYGEAGNGKDFSHV
ncbi:MAG: hypothetical protein LCH61_15505, partial [Proteobacteria bacterium]|nr:hypothetical protein [Pseudomonadota bacterium]